METGMTKQFTFPQHLSVHCSDKILMHINRPTNFQQTLDLSFQHFSSGQHTDVILIPEDGAHIKVHGFILSAASPFIRDVLSNTFSPNLEYSLLLPGTSSTVVSCLSQLLYGATVVTCRDTLVQLYRLVDILGIQMTLITEATTTPFVDAGDDTDMAEENNTLIIPEHVVQQESQDISDQVKDGEDIPDDMPVAEETVGDELPLCCYHCCQPFSSFESLNSHICTKAGGTSGKRHHRCTRCGVVVSSMWRLRQHLAAHSNKKGDRGSGKDDHVYGRSRKKVNISGAKIQVKGDHGYAGAKRHSKDDTEVSTNKDHQYVGTKSRVRISMTPVKYKQESPSKAEFHHSLTPPSSRVQSEHSYGTKRDSSPETESTNVTITGGAHGHSDHIYSAEADMDDTNDNRDGSETDTDIENKDDEKLVAAINAIDHMYSTSTERKSPRFRTILPKDSKSTPVNISKKFACSKCGKSFPQEYRLKRHIREVHDKEKMHECEDCNKKFFKSSSLNRHNLSVHAKLRPFSCSNCGSKFKDKSALKYHMQKNVCLSKSK